MELSPEDSEKLRKVAIAAVALVAGGAIVKYVWEQGKTKGYVYDLKSSRSALIGLIGEIGEKPTQYSGELIRRRGKAPEFKLGAAPITHDQIPEFERVFLELPNNET